MFREGGTFEIGTPITRVRLRWTRHRLALPYTQIEPGTMNRRDWAWVTIIWLVLTALLEFAAVAWSMLPEGFSEESDVVDSAWLVLMVLAVPVFAFMVVMVGYSLVRFRASGPDKDGPPLKGDRKVVGGWLVVTALLALVILINPGFVGLSEIRGDRAADMVIDVEARRFRWQLTYPNGAIATKEFVLPVDTRIRFDVTSRDVLHSFWIPAFRLKIDAVPGRTQVLYATPSETGSLATDANLRVQCAELCGAGHAGMTVPVAVVSQAEFESWVEALAAETSDASGGEGGGG